MSDDQASSQSWGGMFAWLVGFEECVCQRERNRLWEHDLEVNHSYPAVPGFKELPESRGKLPPGPRLRAVPTYQAAEAETMLGDPLLVGTLMQIKLEESVQQMTVALYANGFTMQSISGGKTTNRAWSPFSLVEKCQVKTLQHSAYWAVFKLTVFRAGGHDLCLYFACTGGNAYKERDQWVEKIGYLVSKVTQSLYPTSDLQVQPLPGNEATRTRILAGFLLHGSAMDTCQLVYAELHAYSGGESKMTLYRDAWCDRELSTVALSESTTVSTRSGVYCNVFGIDHHRFCARNADEKDLWLRAVSNVKVKLMFEAPDPTIEEIWIFRQSVQERVALIGNAKDPESKALLLEVTNKPPRSPTGDAMDPAPIEDPTPMMQQSGGSGDVAAGPAGPAGAGPSPESILPGVLREVNAPLEVPAPAVSSSAVEAAEAEATVDVASSEKPPLTKEVECKEEDVAPADGEILPGEGSVATPLPRVRAAGRRRDDATHEAVLQSAALAQVEEPEPEVALESASQEGRSKARLQRRQTIENNLEVSEKALECIAVCSGAQPRALEPRHGFAI